jgi:hypothetical protein
MAHMFLKLIHTVFVPVSFLKSKVMPENPKPIISANFHSMALFAEKVKNFVSAAVR